jgi:urea transport system ATP-binding protein
LRALLTAQAVAKSYGGVRALDGLDLELEAGQLLCIIGPNGCGKTTLFRVLSGETAPDAGRILLEGRAIHGLAPHRVARLGVARKLQTPGIWPELTVDENMAVPLFAAAGRRGFLGLLSRGRQRDAHELLRLAGLAAHGARRAGELAHGAKQWLEIAMLLAVRPKLLLLDEPTAGMTPGETRRTADLIRRIRQEAGIAAIVIEHDLAFVREVNAPVAVMVRGRIVRHGSYAEVASDPMVRELYLGRRA